MLGTHGSREFFVGVAVCAASSVCMGQPVEWPVNRGGSGNFYQIVVTDGPITWDQAKVLAELAGGHLATVTSGAENEFIFSLANNFKYWGQSKVGGDSILYWGPWLGAFQPAGSAEPAGGWAWVTGEEFEFVAWLPGQPNNGSGIESRLHYQSIDLLDSTWNDAIPNESLISSFIVEFFGDCNQNSIPDACDFDCGSEGGPCNLEGCGLGDDCNLNGRLDECDIAAQESQDVNPADGIPDECAGFVGGCPEPEAWSCFDNWDIPGNVFPGIMGAPQVNVTLNQNENVWLDVDAMVNTLRILGNAVLRVTQSGEFGDLTITEPGGLLIEGGTLFINNGRVIDVSAGRVTIGNEGMYHLEPAPAPSVVPLRSPVPEGESLVHSWFRAFFRVFKAHGPSAGEGTLMAQDVEVQPGGTMDLTERMVLEVEQNLVLDGEGSERCESRGAILPPPKLRAERLVLAAVGGDVVLAGTVDVTVSSDNNVTVGGDLNNAATDAQCFDWSQGGLTMDGSQPQTIEAAGRDGGTVAGSARFQGDTNFSMGRVEIAAGRHVTLQNSTPNTMGDGACTEALYVGELTLRAGATLVLSDSRLYYQTLVTEVGAMIVNEGCGELVAIRGCTSAADCEDGNPCTTDRCEPDPGICVHFFNRKPCNDGLYCTKPDVCMQGVCVGTPRCPDLVCSEATRQCLPPEP